MHELSLVTNILKILEKVQTQQKGLTGFLAINITVNPYSCIDEENLNFAFKSLTEHMSVYKKTKIHIQRGNNPVDREFILKSVEVEVSDTEENF